MGKNLYDRELAKTKAILKPESNMKVVLNSFKRELGGMRCVITVGTTTKISFENFQRQLLFREIYVKYLKKKQYIV